MGRPCSICTHPDRETIDKALVAGELFRNLSERYGTSPASLSRHRGEHIATLLAQAKQAQEQPRAVALATQVEAQREREVSHALDVVQQLKAINASSLAILKEARDGKNPDVALKAIDRILRQIELQAKLIGDLDERPVVNLLISPEWLMVRSAILSALADFPEARVVVAARLTTVEATNGHR